MAEKAPTFQDILNLLAILRRRFWIVALCVAVAAVLAAAVSISLSPVYRASTQVLIDPSIRQPFEDKSAPARYLEDTFVVDSQVTVLQSYSVLGKVATQLNLAEDPEFGSAAPGQSFLTLISSLFGNSERSSTATQQVATNKSIEALQGAMTVSREGLTFVINVSVDASTPIKAAILSNSIVENYIADQNGQVSDASRLVEEKVEERLRNLRTQLRDAEANVEAFKAKNNLQSNAQNTFLTDQELAEINTRLTEERAALSAADAKASEIQRLVNSGASVDALSDVTASTTISNLRQQYATAARTQANLTAELLPSHPNLIRARAQTEEIRELINAEVRRIASSAKLEADVLRDRVAKLEVELENVRGRSNIDQQSRIELQELQIEAETSKTLYENLLSRTKEITEMAQISVSNARIISPAIPPESPIWPKKKLLVLVAGLLGGMFGTLLAIGRESLSLGMRYLLYPQNETGQHISGSIAVPSATMGSDNNTLQVNSAPNQREHAISYLPRLPNHGREEETDVHELLNSLWEFKSGSIDREMRPYWKSVFTILKRIQSTRIDGFTSTVIVTSFDGNHSMAALSVVFAAASLKNFRVLLVDNNSASLQLTDNVLPENRLAANLHDAVLTADLGIDYLNLTQGRRKYQNQTTGDYQLLNQLGQDPEFDLTVISESPLTLSQIESVLEDSADHAIISVERPAILT